VTEAEWLACENPQRMVQFVVSRMTRRKLRLFSDAVGPRPPLHFDFYWGERGTEEAACQARLVRELFGNPFFPVTILPAWLTPTVTRLAAVAYEERALPSGELDPVRLAVLADALEDAGCADADILTHLRSAGPHVRGCWALDLILGKE
jgi:hypothetical protein